MSGLGRGDRLIQNQFARLEREGRRRDQNQAAEGRRKEARENQENRTGSVFYDINEIDVSVLKDYLNIFGNLGERRTRDLKETRRHRYHHYREAGLDFDNKRIAEKPALPSTSSTTILTAANAACLLLRA